MVESELFESFSKLDSNEKRNQINSELEKLGLLLGTVHERYRIERMVNAINSYDKITDEKMTDDEYFNLIYKNIIYIRKDVLTLVNALMNQKF